MKIFIPKSVFFSGKGNGFRVFVMFIYYVHFKWNMTQFQRENSQKLLTLDLYLHISFWRQFRNMMIVKLLRGKNSTVYPPQHCTAMSVHCAVPHSFPRITIWSHFRKFAFECTKWVSFFSTLTAPDGMHQPLIISQLGAFKSK